MGFSIVFLILSASIYLAAAEDPTTMNPVDQKIAATQKAMRSTPSSPEPHIDLAAEYCRKARDSEDISYYGKAETELDSALKLSPGNYDAQKLKVTILLGRHEFTAALKLAAELNHSIPDDIALWGLLAEINAATGDYKEALRDAQWVLDLRPGSTLGFTEAARLREAYGDPEGAIEFYQEAHTRTALSDAEERAWLLTQVARLTSESGDRKRAAALFDEARKLNPGSQLAIAGLARSRMLEGNFSEAVSLLEIRYKAVQDARSLYDFAEALERAGRQDQAAAAFRDFEAKAKAETERPYNANLELIHYYLDRKSNPAEALAIAQRESAVRRDSQTLAALAGACKAAQIAAALNDSERAACQFELAKQQ